ncbi:MAG: radical SAM protein, partial [Planctomycetota bacterium]|nr:radical SAM protein [Planctomycetota bacterium]
EELLRVKREWGLEIVKFYDDLFPFEPGKGLEEFAREYRTKVALPFHCLTRAERMTDDFARLLKEAGCYSISMSIESGNEEYRRKYLRRHMSDRTILDAYSTCRKYGINTFANTILGLPGTELEDEFRSVEINLEAGADLALFPIFHPYPTTELAETARTLGLWDGSLSSFGISYMEESPLAFPRMRKRIQNNLALLGTVAAVFPWAWPFLRRLTRLRENRLFFLLYYVCKMWIVEHKIYPGGISLAGLARNALLDLRKFGR